MSHLRLVPALSEPSAEPTAPKPPGRPKKRLAPRSKKHQGVTLLAPVAASRTGWRARWRDPDSGREVKETLDRALSTHELRTAWCVAKADELRTRKVKLLTGAVRRSDQPLGEAVARYYAAHDELAPRTIAAYKAATDRLLKWAKDNRVRTTDDLTRPILMDFTVALKSAAKGRAVGKGKRGQYAPSGERRANVSVNRDLRSVRTVLGYLVELDLCAHLTFDDLRRSLKLLGLAHETPEFLSPAAIQQLMAACSAHDSATYALTRDEHDGLREPGTTPRYAPITPFVRFLLLSGCRLAEATTLTCGQVDLDSQVVRLRGYNNKTKRARIVNLDVSPSLIPLLRDLVEDRPSGALVFDLTYDQAGAAGHRLQRHGAPQGFCWQLLRSTCATYLTCAPSIYGAASAYLSTRRLGHSLEVAENHYLGQVKISPEAKTLEQAMQLD